MARRTSQRLHLRPSCGGRCRCRCGRRRRKRWHPNVGQWLEMFVSLHGPGGAGNGGAFGSHHHYPRLGSRQRARHTARASAAAVRVRFKNWQGIDSAEEPARVPPPGASSDFVRAAPWVPKPGRPPRDKAMFIRADSVAASGPGAAPGSREVWHYSDTFRHPSAQPNAHHAAQPPTPSSIPATLTLATPMETPGPVPFRSPWAH